MLAAVERGARIPEAERDSGASTDALLRAADLHTGVSDLTSQVVGLAQLIVGGGRPDDLGDPA